MKEPIRITFRDISCSIDRWSHEITTFYPEVFKLDSEMFIDGDVYKIVQVAPDIKADVLSLEITLKMI